MGLAIATAVMIFGTAGPASAAERPGQYQAASVWVQPGTAPLDGLGTFVYVGQPLTPGPTQGSPEGYEYTVTFRLQDGSLGIVAIGHQNGQKVAGFGIVDHTLVSVVPYDWKYGQIYYLLTYRLSATQWGAWVYDWTSTTWSPIAVLDVPEAAGRMLPEVATVVDYDAGPVAPPPGADSTCAFYPRVDVLFYAPMGWRGDVITSATFKEYDGFDGPCLSTTVPVNGWQWTTMGQAAA